ncbi:phosphonoacetaldehyde hydrolase [Amantichitinum ursilacus]|uniref:Phosphonoacetaldehyde hydrolase n=1 Tax=Amantichitinum ursilacus TaxID=857265 RepID=A0A0N0XGM0_9NEIS|nr:phosphonoacetaldehyde hydrolase [Amantichitinum ursilacus]KPC49950.1 Phosphonoacetaldehyde hydrolase [Amantichitinum ursilacus]
MNIANPSAARRASPIAAHLQAVIFDWAGTIVDFGSFAPTQVLVEAFAGFDIALTLDEARGPMGVGKWQHIEALAGDPAIAPRWQKRFGRAVCAEDVDTLYQAFMPLQIARVGHYSWPVPGALDMVERLRAAGLRIGSCSGYPRQVMNALLPLAEERGYTPDTAIAADDLAAGGRPGPWMALATVLELGIDDVAACVKVDDSTPGIEEGLRAGMWTVGLSASGNEVGLTFEEWQALSASEQLARTAPAEQKLRDAGAHYVIDTVADLWPVLQDIAWRRSCGERP